MNGGVLPLRQAVPQVASPGHAISVAYGKGKLKPGFLFKWHFVVCWIYIHHFNLNSTVN